MESIVNNSLPPSRKEAVRLAVKNYFTGKSCVRGHISERIVLNGRCVKCSYDDHKKYVSINPEKYKNLNKLYYYKNPEKKIMSNKLSRVKTINKVFLSQAKNRSKRFNLEFNLSLEDIIIPEICPVLEIPLYLTIGKRTDNTPSLDRIDNTKGYIKGNVRVISWRANRIKCDASFEEIEKLYNYMKETL